MTDNQTPSQYTRELYKMYVYYVISDMFQLVMDHHREKHLYTKLGITAGLTHLLTWDILHILRVIIGSVNGTNLMLEIYYDKLLSSLNYLIILAFQNYVYVFI